MADPEGIHHILLRENSEGIYPGREGDLADLVTVMPDQGGRAEMREMALTVLAAYRG